MAWEESMRTIERNDESELERKLLTPVNQDNGIKTDVAVFYEWFILAMWKEWKKFKSWVEMNVLCIVDQYHYRWVTRLDHTSKCKAIYLIVNPPLKG